MKKKSKEGKKKGIERKRPEEKKERKEIKRESGSSEGPNASSNLGLIPTVFKTYTHLG